MTDAVAPPNEPIDEVSELPRRVLSTYSRLWQFETWLRRMVYVELRALKGDEWNASLPSSKKSFDADKRLIHMPTPEEDPISYAQLSALEEVIKGNWRLFDRYLPPLSIWTAKLEEISQIRHRVAHFRMGHADDYRRLIQFLRDIDPGFWKFCTSYNDARPALPPKEDPVTARFLEYDPFPWTEVEDKHWARVGIADPALVLAITIEALERPWAEAESKFDGQTGYLYDIYIIARDHRTFDYGAFLKNTRSVHPHLVHISLSTFANSVRLTIPAVLGAAKVIEIIERCLEAGLYTVSRRPLPSMGDRTVQLLADEWPEYVLGPENPMTFLTPDMPCKFFNA